MDYKKISQDVVDHVGGISNIKGATHCVTRLRLILNDETKYDRKALENIEGVKGVLFNSGQLMIIFGSVYRSFGYNLPRTSSELRRAGRKVSYNEKQPGDIICYNGHVAMYIGNGKIVHASNRRTGIKISPRANYRRIVCVRRVVE